MSYSMAKRQKMEEIGLLTSQIADSLNVYFEDAVNAMNFFRSDITLRRISGNATGNPRRSAMSTSERFRGR